MTNAAQNRVATLIEALPYIQRFHDKIIVVKYGGNVMGAAKEARQASQNFARDVVLLKQIGFHPIVVHGGGPLISKALEHEKIETRFVHGVRVTCADSLRVVDATLQSINEDLCEQIRHCGGKPLSLAQGERAVCARKLEIPEAPDEDLGYAGEAIGIRADLEEITRSASIPVVSPVGQSEDKTYYNVNADFAAASIAKHLQSEKLILMTNTPGVLDAGGKLVSTIALKQAQTWIEQGIIQGGMIPKIRCAFHAIDGGVHTVHIIDGCKQHALLLELLTDAGVGTLIAKDQALL